MKIVAIIITSCLLMFSCGETEDFLNGLNESPQINFMGDSKEPVLVDSMKYKILDVVQRYQIKLKVTDRNENITDVKFNQLQGNGKLMQNEVQVISNNIQYKKDSSLLEFAYIPEVIGNHKLSITVTDGFGISKTAVIELTVFENLLPNAKFSVSKIGKFSPYEWQIDASESFDRDQKYGGEIVEYEFNVLGKQYRVLGKTINVIFPLSESIKSGVFEIGVRVKDNDGKFSALNKTSLLVD